MSRAHPLFNVDDILDSTLAALNLIRYLSVRVRLLCALQIASEVLEKRHLLLKVLRVVCQCVFSSNVLSVRTATFHVVKVEAVGVKADLG